MERPTDPKEIVTPEAFHIAEELLGRPLAHPMRRAGAMAIDLLAVILLANAGGVFLAIAAAVVLFRMATRSREDGAMAGWVRGTLGCIGAVALFVSVLLIWDALFDRDTDPPERRAEAAGDVVEMSLGEAGATLAEVLAFRRAETRDEAQVQAVRIARRLDRLGLTNEEIRETLIGLTEMKSEPWVEAAVQEALTAIDTLSQRARLTGDSLVLAYAAALQAGDTVQAAALRADLAEAVAGDRLTSLERRIDRLESRNNRLEDELEEAREGPGILAFLGNVSDELGVGFGWFGLYFTFFLAFWSGRTPGKRILRVRVVRLDGKPITWWVAFNRFGGYAASIFTGLLGFAEMFWDANRQALHDRIAHTVVVRD